MQESPSPIPHPPSPDVELGKMVGPFGIKGEVKLEPYADSPARYNTLKGVTAVWPDGRRTPLTVTGARKHKTHILMRFEGVDNPNQAETLRGAVLVVPFSERAPLEKDRYYISDLIGMSVITTSGEEIGPVLDVLQTRANDVYVTARGMVPAVKEFVRDIDLERRRIVVSPVEGMFEPVTAEDEPEPAEPATLKAESQDTPPNP